LANLKLKLKNSQTIATLFINSPLRLNIYTSRPIRLDFAIIRYSVKKREI